MRQSRIWRVVIALVLSGVVTTGALGGSARADSTRQNQTAWKCHEHGEAIFWTASDWDLLGQELAAQLSPCVQYYISIPPVADDKTVLREKQDDVVRRLGPQFHPVAEIRLGNDTGWANWVTGASGRTWFDAGVESRRRMAEAGYRFDLGETWLVNEFDRTTARDEPPYTRKAMTELLRGLYYGDGTGPTVPGIVEIGIAYTHQNIPDVTTYKSELKSWLRDSDFWTSVNPYISVLTKETYPDARLWGVAGTSRDERVKHLTQYMEHAMNLVHAGPPGIAAARSVFDRAYMPLANGTWPALGPDPYTPPFCCGHGWTMMPLDSMQTFVSEQIYTVSRYAANHLPNSPRSRVGFSWQPTNNYKLAPDRWEAAKRAIASRIGAAIRSTYTEWWVKPQGACSVGGGKEDSLSEWDWCRGADVDGAALTDAWATFERWN